MPRVWSVVSAWSAVANALASAAAPAALRSVAVTLMTYELGSIDVCTLPLNASALRRECSRCLTRATTAGRVTWGAVADASCNGVCMLTNDPPSSARSWFGSLTTSDAVASYVFFCTNDSASATPAHTIATASNEQSLTLDHIEISAQREFPGLFRHVSKVPRARSYRALPGAGLVALSVMTAGSGLPQPPPWEDVTAAKLRPRQ